MLHCRFILMSTRFSAVRVKYAHFLKNVHNYFLS